MHEKNHAEALARCIQEKERWIQWPLMDGDTREVLQSQTEEETFDSFYQKLVFGTGGLRGVLGAGDNRMNLYTVRKATQGLANYLNQLALPKRVAIAYDSRIGSEDFAKASAEVLAANGILAFLYPRLEPTPALSWAVRDLKCGGGICITASHNPAQYNGYKVYGADGCQITLEAAWAIEEQMGKIDVLEGVQFVDFASGLADGKIQWIPEETLEGYLQAVEAQALAQETDKGSVKVVYTPLNGAGKECVIKILERTSVDEVRLVPQQAEPDGHFPTCPYPNPEIPETLALGLAMCREHQPDLLLATDPDCDRVGVAAWNGKDYALFSGNEVGVLLMDYVCKQRIRRGLMPERPVAVTTIVSSAMATPIAKRHGVELRRTLTGFKYIGEQIGLLEQKGEAERFIFGFEESNGYLSGTHVRDKDGVNAAMLICEMARWYKAQGQTLWQAMERLYAEFGYYHTALYSYSFQGTVGMDRMNALMETLRHYPSADIGGRSIESVLDYQNAGTGLPKANVLEFHLAENCKLMIRPSGTEPKMKAYVFTAAPDRQGALRLEESIRRALEKMMK